MPATDAMMKGELPRLSNVEPEIVKNIVKLDDRSMVWAHDQAASDVEALAPFTAIVLVFMVLVQVPMFQHEYDALVSLIFNMGSFKKCPKLLSKLNTKDCSGCCSEFADITNGGTAGLVTRRKAEMDIFTNSVYHSKH